MTLLQLHLQYRNRIPRPGPQGTKNKSTLAKEAAARLATCSQPTEYCDSDVDAESSPSVCASSGALTVRVENKYSQPRPLYLDP